MEINEFKKTFFRFLNEGKAESFRDAYYPDVDDYILNKVIEIDPKSNGDDLSEYGKFLLKLKPTQSDVQQAANDIAIYAKAVENGAEVPDMNEITSFEELHYIAVDIANAKSHLNSNEMEAQEESFNSPVVFDDGGFKIVEITSEEAAEYYGGGTMWPWVGKTAEGTMFSQFAQAGKIYVIVNKTDNVRYSAMKRGTRVRISDVNDELVDKNIFPNGLLNAILSIAENYKQEKKTLMNESIVNGMVSALYENYNKKHIKGNELKNSMNALCECVSKKDDINTDVKERLNIVVETYEKVGKDITVDTYPEIMNMVSEGFGDRVADFAHKVKGKLIGTPEEAAATSEAITNAIVKKLHEVFPVAREYAGKNLKGFGKTIVDLCLIAGEDVVIDQVLRPIIQQEVESALENNPTTNYRDRKRCFEFVKDCFGYSGGLLYNTSDLINAAKEAVGINESKKHSTTLSENELNDMLFEAVGKNVKRFLSENKSLNIEKPQTECKAEVTETELHEIIGESIRKHLMEAFSDIYDWQNFDNDRDADGEEYVPDYIDCIDPATLSDTLETMGWSYYDSVDIRDKQGREYVAYMCRPAGNSKYGIEDVIENVKKVAEMPNGIFYEEGVRSYAPEQRTYRILVEVVPKENYGKQLNLNMQDGE